MEYDRGDSFLSDFGQNGTSFGSKPKGKLSTRSLRESEANVVPVSSHIWVVSSTFKQL